MAYLDYQSTFLKPNFSPIYAMDLDVDNLEEKAKQWSELHG